jgi:hypothetical protein
MGNKPAVQQTWQALQDYFTEKWLKCCQYSQATVKHSRFKDVALATQELAVVEEEGEMMAMMFVLLQEQHKSLMKIRTEDEMISVSQQMVDRMEVSGLGLKHHQLDNECSENFKQCIRQNGMTHELVPPDNHQRNMAKRAIQTFKHHFVSILSGVNNIFLLSLWCHLVQPAEFNVNLLRQSNVAPKVSAYTHVHGQHDYMR